MNSEDETLRRLTRSSYEDLLHDMGGSMYEAFNGKEIIVRANRHLILKKHNWTEKEFFNELGRRIKNA
jgi:hypothetical protein